MHHESLSPDELEVLLTSQGMATSPSSSADASVRDCDAHTDESLADLHARFASDLGAVLTQLTRRDVAVKLREAVLGTYGQFVFGQTVPTCCAVVVAEPIQAELFLAIDPAILFPMLDRMLGCDLPAPAQRRCLSEIETAIVSLLVEQVLAKYREAWQPVLSLQLSVDRFEHNTQQMRALPGSDLAYLVRYDLRCDRDRGWAQFCIPWKSTQQIRERLAANR